MISQFKLRRLASRAIRVATDHTDIPVIASMKDLIITSATTYLEKYDLVKKAEVEKSNEYKEGRDALNKLNETVKGIISSLNAHFPSLPISIDFNGVPDDIFESISLLIDKINDIEDKPEAVTNILIPELQTSLERAETEWREAEKSRTDYQLTQKALREAGTDFFYNLRLFRRAVGYTLGRSNYDYQKLRDSFANNTEPEDPKDPEDPEVPTTT